MSTQDVLVEALLNIRCIVKGYHLCRFEVNVGEVFTANKKNAETRLKSVNHRGQLGHLQSELVDPLWPLHADIPGYVVNFLINFLSIPIYLSIGIDNRYQSITTRIFPIDWSSIININRLIDIDWYRLIFNN